MREARRLAGARASRVGFHGGSQGGWVAPLAATRVDADFVVVGYGLAVSPLAEDRGEVMQGLVAAGFDDPGVLRKAREATDATATVIASGFERGYEQLDAVRARYGAEPWWPAIAGEFSGEMLRTDNDSIRRYGPLRVHGTTWEYEPMPVLRRVQVPQLWIQAGDDTEAPPAETRARLLAPVAEGRPLSVVEFPTADHDILEFEAGADGRRRATRHSDGFFRLLVDWIRDGRMGDAPYGNARVLSRAGDH